MPQERKVTEGGATWNKVSGRKQDSCCWMEKYYISAWPFPECYNFRGSSGSLPPGMEVFSHWLTHDIPSAPATLTGPLSCCWSHCVPRRFQAAGIRYLSFIFKVPCCTLHLAVCLYQYSPVCVRLIFISLNLEDFPFCHTMWGTQHHPTKKAWVCI